MGNKNVYYVIGATDTSTEAIVSAISNLKKLDAQSEATAQKMKSQWESVRANYLKVTAGIAAAMVTVKKAWDLAEAYAGYEEQRDMLRGLAASYDTTADGIIQSMQDASEGLISKADLMKTAVSGLAKGLDPAMLQKLASMAGTLGDAVDKDATTALIDLAEALENGKEKMLKTYISAEALDRVMSQCSKTANEHEKKQMRLNAVIEAYNRINAAAGAETMSTADKMEKFKAIVSNVGLAIGSVLVSAGLAAVGMFQWLAAGAMTAAATVMKLTIPLGILSDWTGRTKGQADYNRKQVEMMEGAAAELAGKAAENFKIAFGQIEPVVKAKVQISGGDYESKADKAAAEKAAKEALRIQKERFQEAQRLYDADQALYVKSEQAKIQQTYATANRQADMAQWVFDHSAQTYDDEVSMIQTKRDALVGAAQVEQAAIVAMIENYGRSKDKQGEIAALRVQWSEAYQAELDAESTAMLATMDLEQRRFEQYVEQTTRMQEDLQQLQRSVTDSAFSMAGITGSQADLMDIIGGVDPFSQMRDLENQYYTDSLANLDLYQATYAARTGVFLSQEAARIQIAKDHEKRIIQLAGQQQAYTYASALGVMSAAAGSMYAALGEKGKAFFYIQQALAVAQAVVSAFLSSQLAYQSQLMLPTPDAPGRAAAAAAAALKFGLFNAAMIAATAIGNIAAASGSSDSGGGSSGSSSGSSAASTDTTTSTEEKTKSYVVNVYYYGHVYGVSADALARDLLPAIRKAEADGV